MEVFYGGFYIGLDNCRSRLFLASVFLTDCMIFTRINFSSLPVQCLLLPLAATQQLARCLFLSNAAQTYSPNINLLVSVTGSQKLTFVTRSQFPSDDCSLQIMEPCWVEWCTTTARSTKPFHRSLISSEQINSSSWFLAIQIQIMIMIMVVVVVATTFWTLEIVNCLDIFL